MRRTYHGYYKPLNPKKVIGDPTKIYYRSSWEKKIMMKLDISDYIHKWGSEVVIIPYVSPKDGKVHRYFVDFIIITKTNNQQNVVLIEVKPKSQKYKPRNTASKKDSTYLNEIVTYEVNQAKWAAAEKYCDARGWTFKVMTEDQIFPKMK